MMTLLYSGNNIGGLEVMDRAGRWVPVPVTDGAFTVNLGDLSRKKGAVLGERYLAPLREVSPSATRLPTLTFPGAHAIHLTSCSL
jgi:hypothetical protein